MRGVLSKSEESTHYDLWRFRSPRRGTSGFGDARAEGGRSRSRTDIDNSDTVSRLLTAAEALALIFAAPRKERRWFSGSPTRIDVAFSEDALTCAIRVVLRR